MKVYFVRHGETYANASKCFAGHWDVDLTDKGKIQACDVAEKLKTHVFEKIYVSDLKRAKETAEAILVHHQDITPVVTPALREMNFGRWEHKSFSEIKKNEGALLKKWFADFQHFKVPEGESVLELYTRVVAAYEEMIAGADTESDTHFLVVAHGGVIQCLLSYLCFGDVSGYWRFRIDNCKVNYIEYAMGMPVVQGINQ